jgi:hypothetical protein
MQEMQNDAQPEKRMGSSTQLDRRAMGRWMAAFAATAVIPSFAKQANADDFQLIMNEKPLPPPTNPYEIFDIGQSYRGNRGPNLQVREESIFLGCLFD